MHHRLSLDLLTCLLLITLAALPACRSPEQRERDRWAEMQREAFREPSEVLTAAFDTVLDDYLARLERQGHDVDPATREQIMDNLLDAVPGLLLAGEQMERSFQRGEFRNAENQRRVDRLLNQARMIDMQLPGLTQMLATRHRRGELRDAELEILRRLMDHHMDRLGERLWPS